MKFIYAIGILLVGGCIVGSCVGAEFCSVGRGPYVEGLGKLSPDDTTVATHLLYQAETRTDFETFQQLTGIDLTETSVSDRQQLQCDLYFTALDHYHHRSFFVKVASLMTLSNIAAVGAVILLVILLFVLAHDIILFIVATVSLAIVQLLFSGRVIRYGGLLLSLFLMCLKEAPCPRTQWLFFLDEFTPLLGQLIFTGVALHFALDHNANDNAYAINNALAINLSIVAGISNTLYHGHWALGVLTVLLAYARAGFFAVGFFGTYIIGFSTRTAMLRCLVVSSVIVPAFIMIRLYDPIMYAFCIGFETGIIFWGGFVGLLSLLILSDMDFTNRYLTTSNSCWLLNQLMLIVACLLSVGVGAQLQYDSLKSFGGTFLVFWALDLQRILTFQFGARGIRIVLFLGFLNLYALRYFILNYPGYFILN